MHREFDKDEWRLGNSGASSGGDCFRQSRGKAPPLSEQYSDRKGCCALTTEDMEIAISMSWTCDFNWKVMIEN
jgi:hypothetical protein